MVKNTKLYLLRTLSELISIKLAKLGVRRPHLPEGLPAIWFVIAASVVPKACCVLQLVP